MAQVVGSRRKRWLETVLVYAMLGILVLAFVFPLIWVLGLSLKTRLQIFATPPLYLWWPTLENYADVLTRSDFAQAFINTLIVSASAVLLSLCVGVPAAYAFARFPFTGRTFLFFALLVMRMLPPIAVLVPMYVLFSKLGLATTRFSVVLADTTFALPLVVWLMRGFFEDLPAELEEKRLDRRRQPLSCVLAHRSAVGAARLGRREHFMPAIGVERFSVCGGADQQCDADLAGHDGGVQRGRFRCGLGRAHGIRRAGHPAGNHFLLHRAETPCRRAFFRRH